VEETTPDGALRSTSVVTPIDPGYDQLRATAQPGEEPAWLRVGEFCLEDKAAVEKFEQRLSEYCAARGQFDLKHISLAKAYPALQRCRPTDWERVFSCVLDLQINFVLLHCDDTVMGGITNIPALTHQPEVGSVLDSPDLFFRKMDYHRFVTSFIFRYRAIWDKVMGLTILLRAPGEYERLKAAKSKKKAFDAIMQSVAPGTAAVSAGLERFENLFRTPEIHKSGRMRKYSFLPVSAGFNPQHELGAFWNWLNRAMIDVGKALADLEPGGESS
jgi:hypothetical protein